MEGGGTGNTDPGIAFFFVSYLLINSIMLLNVVVAVLLDEFVSSVTREKEEEKRLAEMEINKRKVIGCLDPLTSELITFADNEDLQERIDIIWTKLDVDNDGALGYEEFQVRLPLVTPLHAQRTCSHVRCLTSQRGMSGEHQRVDETIAWADQLLDVHLQLFQCPRL